jgi:hypothetical protein
MSDKYSGGHPMKRLTFILSILIIGSAAVSACSRATSETNPDDLALVVSRTQTAIAVLNVATHTLESPVSEVTPSATETTFTPTQTTTPTTIPTETPTLTLTFTPQPSDCTNKASFEEETIKDDTSFGANKNFTKTWTLRNTGTCTWTPDYKLVFEEGDSMGAATSTLIGQTVPPDDTATLSIDLTAPGTSGSYQGDFLLQSPGGQKFGLGSNADKTFWVKIRVVETTSELNLGDPSWSDDFNSDSGLWPLGKDAQIGFKIDNSTLVITAYQSIGDQWRLNGNLPAKNLFLEMNVKTGESCSGKDSYGMIVRSTESDKDVFDSGYVFTFSCDGMFRLYSMDNGTYVSLLNWTSSGEINTGPDQNNRMGIWVDDTTIRLYANGNRIAQVNDSRHESGKWGLSIRSVDSADFSIAVEDISYWVLED